MNFTKKIFTCAALLTFTVLGTNIISAQSAVQDNAEREDTAQMRSQASVPEGMYRNPLLKSGPDPWALWYGDRYYYTNTTGKKLTLWETNDITDLRNSRKKIVWEPDDTTAIYSQHVWAPEIHRIDDKWYIYFTADDGDTDNHQMFVLENTAKDPFEGEFVMKGRISTDPANNWAIDGSLFEHKGELYMVWSGWERRRVTTETQCIYIARMANPWTLGSERVLISKPEYEWERHNLNPDGTRRKHTIYVNEGPQPLKSPGGKWIHVAYSASGTWTPYYCLGLLSASADADLLDPASWVKSDKAVFEQSPRDSVFCVGHNSFFRSPDGKEDYILYHGKNSEKSEIRSPRAQKFTWDENDYPVFGTPHPIETLLEKPSGTTPNRFVQKQETGTNSTTTKQ